MRNLLLLLSLVLLIAPAALATDDARAQEILKQARQAIGGDEQLQKIQSLQINGQYRRVFGDHRHAAVVDRDRHFCRRGGRRQEQGCDEASEQFHECTRRLSIRPYKDVRPVGTASCPGGPGPLYLFRK